MDRTYADILESVEQAEQRNDERRRELDRWRNRILSQLKRLAERRIRSEAARQARKLLERNKPEQPTSTIGPKSPASSLTPVPPSPQMKTDTFCNQCGQRFRNDHAFCTHCGTARRNA